jgi:uncharacterized membrane protein YhhN
LNDVSVLILILILLLAIHLVEEIRTGFRYRIPFGPMPKSVFIWLNILIYTFCFITLYLSLLNNQFAVPLTWAFAVGMLLNGLGHISMMLVRRNYFPGGITAFLLVPASILLITRLLAH